jgi:hypothetical protein
MRTQAQTPKNLGAAKPHWLTTLDEDDKRLSIVQALELEGGCVIRAAMRLETTRMTLWRWLREANMLGVPTQIKERTQRRFRLAG